MTTDRGSELIKVPENADLFDKVVSILEQAKSNVVKSVNSNMVIAYWLIGRAIVEEIQGGEERAEYGKTVVEDLSKKLNRKYGKGFSTTNLWYFRQFYLVYSNRNPVILHKLCGESDSEAILHKPCGVLDDMQFSVEKSDSVNGFSSSLSWSHYRTLSKVENNNERMFYEIEAEREGWSVPVLQRQINSFLFARLLKSSNKKGVLELAGKGQEVEKPGDVIKSPYILDFLGLPDSKQFHEADLEQAIIDNLQSFILELGKGFAFVARQKRIVTDTKNFYIDLVFFNYHLNCFVIIDLKIGELTHQDVGQMDMYVRMFDDLEKNDNHNPTVGIILCTEKDSTIVKYSVLNDNEKLFASKYMLYLPTEEELAKELQRERKLIEQRLKERLENK